MNDKLKLDNNDGAVFHINTDREIYFSIKDINQKETMVSISEVYRALRNIETLLGGNVKFEEPVEEVGWQRRIK